MNPTLLITSAGHKVPLLESAIAHRKGSEIPWTLWAADRDPHSPCRSILNNFWTMPPQQSWQKQAIAEALLERGINLVLPTRNGELSWWAEHRGFFADHGIVVVVSEPKAIARSTDKWACFSRLSGQHCPVIPTHLSLPEHAQGLWLAKERFGAGGTPIIGLPKNLHKQAAALKQPIFQPYIRGTEYSIDIYRNRQGVITAAVPRRRDRIVHGESQISTIVDDAPLGDLAGQVVEHIGGWGPMVVQCIIDEEGTPYILEINPRIGGASTLSIAGGLPLWTWLHREAMGQPIPPPLVRGRPLRLVRVKRDLLEEAPAVSPT